MVPTNALQRTFQILVGDSCGTCFTIDVGGKQYIVTARHVIGNPTDSMTVRLQHDGVWKSLECRHVGTAPDEIDISVLAPSHAISPSHPLEPTTAHLYLSQDVYFLGFPYGLRNEVGALNANFPLPLVKKACVSMMSLTPDSPRYVLLDGHNNPGFSGGPVIFASPPGHPATRVLGVVSGYRFEWDPVFSQETKTPLTVKLNTGLVIAYAIDYAVELIKANPVGAPVTA